MTRTLTRLVMILNGTALLLSAAIAWAGPPDLERAFAERDLAPLRAWLQSENSQSENSHESPEVLRVRAWLVRHEGDLDQARKLLNRAIDLEPEPVALRADLLADRARVLTILIDQAGPFAAMRLARQIRQDLEAAVALEPDHIDAVDALYGFHLRAPGLVGGRRARATALERRLERIAPERLAYREAKRLADEGRLERAVGHLERAVEQAGQRTGRAPRDWRLRLAQWHREAGNHESALETLEPLLERSGEYRPALYELGRIAAQSGLCAEVAIDALERFLAMPDWPSDPSPGMAWWQLGRIFEHLGREREALRAYGRALVMDIAAPVRTETGLRPALGASPTVSFGSEPAS